MKDIMTQKLPICELSQKSNIEIMWRFLSQYLFMLEDRQFAQVKGILSMVRSFLFCAEVAQIQCLINAQTLRNGFLVLKAVHDGFDPIL